MCERETDTDGGREGGRAERRRRWRRRRRGDREGEARIAGERRRNVGGKEKKMVGRALLLGAKSTVTE